MKPASADGMPTGEIVADDTVVVIPWLLAGYEPIGWVVTIAEDGQCFARPGNGAWGDERLFACHDLIKLEDLRRAIPDWDRAGGGRPDTHRKLRDYIARRQQHALTCITVREDLWRR